MFQHIDFLISYEHTGFRIDAQIDECCVYFVCWDTGQMYTMHTDTDTNRTYVCSVCMIYVFAYVGVCAYGYVGACVCASFFFEDRNNMKLKKRNSLCWFQNLYYVFEFHGLIMFGYCFMFWFLKIAQRFDRVISMVAVLFLCSTFICLFEKLVCD